ncbi:MAG: hypothetical protein N2D54_10350 [Chloroflexota bacterium]
MKRTILLIISLVAGLSLACSQTANLALPTLSTNVDTQPAEVEPGSAEPQTLPTSGESPDDGAGPTAISSSTPIAGVEPVCVQATGFPPLEADSYEDYPAAIQAFLNEGGPVGALVVALELNGFSNVPNAATEVEITGDGKQDVIVTITRPDAIGDPKPGAILFYVCQGDHFELVQVEQPAETHGAPVLLLVQDINNQSPNEIIYSSPFCEEHSCFEDAQIMSWDGAEFVSHLDEGTASMPFPNMQVVDYDEDGVYDFEAVSAGFASIEAGPQRDLSRVWSYDQQTELWQVTSQAIGVSNYRIHILHDADGALGRGEYEIAILFYNRVIHEATLSDWVDPANERLVLGAYARFKITAAHVLKGDLGAAQNFLGEMAELYEPFTTPYTFVDMAQLFIEGYKQGGEPAGCAAVVNYANERAETVLLPLGSTAFGYANPDYRAEDLCP